MSDALALMRSSLTSMHASDADTSSKVKLYSAGIEVCCRNNADKEALELLQELADQTGHSVAIPRSCYLLLFSHCAGNGGETARQQLERMCVSMAVSN